MRRESERDARIRRAITTAATASAVVLLAGAALTNTNTTTNDANTHLMYASLGETPHGVTTRNDGMTSASAYAALGEAGGAVRHPNSAAERARQRRDARRAERVKAKEEEEAKKKGEEEKAKKTKTKRGFFRTPTET